MPPALWTRFLGALSLFAHWIYTQTRASALFGLVVHWLPKSATNLPAMDAVEQVSPHTYRILGQNPGTHTLQGTNLYLVVGQSREAILIDSGESWSAGCMLPLLMQLLQTKGVRRIAHVLLTHGHPDHNGGVTAVLEALQAAELLPLPIIHKKLLPLELPTAYELVDIADNEAFWIDGLCIQAVYTAGHTPDHVAFVMAADRAVFTGDCVLGCGTAVFDDLTTYMRSLSTLRALFEGDLLHIYPGHGPVITNRGLAKVDEYISHRLTREAEVLAAVTTTPKSSLQLVRLVYGSKLPQAVLLSAQANLLQHLHKLKEDGKVDYCWPDLWCEHGVADG